MPSIREQILSAIVARLNTIGTSGGYQSTPPEGWATRISLAGPPVGHPNAFVYRSFENIRDNALQLVECDLSVVIDVVTTAEGDGIEPELDPYVSDVQRAVMLDPTWGGLAIDTFLRSTVSFPPPVNLNEYAVTVNIEVQYRHSRTDPSSPS